MTDTLIMYSLMVIALAVWCLVDDYFQEKDKRQDK